MWSQGIYVSQFMPDFFELGYLTLTANLMVQMNFGLISLAKNRDMKNNKVVKIPFL